MDSIVVVFRHATISVLQYDASVNQMKTVGQHCCAGEVELLKASSSCVGSRISRVEGNVLATQFTASSFTLIQLGSEISSFTVPVKLSCAIRLASIDDACFLPTKPGGSISLAVLGKTRPHAWVGRASTISTTCSAVRMLSVDFFAKSVSVNWSFESLPTGAHSLVPLPPPRGGIVVVSADTVSFCEEFSSSVTFPVNRAAEIFLSCEEKSSGVHFLTPPGSEKSDDPIVDLAGSRQAALTDDLVIFTTSSEKVFACHLVRQDGTFSSVSALVWEELNLLMSQEEQKNGPAAALCMSANRDKLLIASAENSTKLYQISWREILLPISVFASSAEESQLAALEESSTADEGEEFEALVRMYQEEVHKGKIARSVELGLVDEMNGFGAIVFVEQQEEGIMLASKSGHIMMLWDEIPFESVFELSLKKMNDSLFSFSWRFVDYLALSNASQFLLVDCSNGLKEVARTNITNILEIVPMVTLDGHLYLLTGEGIVSVSLPDLSLNILEEFDANSAVFSDRRDESGTLFVGVYSSSAVEIFKLSSSSPSIESRFEINLNNNTLLSLSLSVANDDACFACITAGASLYMYRNAELVFVTRHASLCKPVLSNQLLQEDAEEASLSITDASRRPLEANQNLGMFAEKIKLNFAKLVYADSDHPVLILLVEGRPPLVYQQFGKNKLDYRFSLVPLDMPHFFTTGARTCVRETSISNLQGVWISLSLNTSVFLSKTNRGQLFLHPIGISASCISQFDSPFARAAAVVLDSNSTNSTTSNLKIFKFINGTDLSSQFPAIVHSLPGEGHGAMTAESVAGIAVDFVTLEEEEDETISSAAPMISNEEFEMMDENIIMPPDLGSSVEANKVVVACPMPPSRQKHQVRIYSNKMFETVSSIIQCQNNEMVTGMTWAESILGLGSDVLIIGTTLLLGEETPAQGRLVVVRVDYAPGLVAPDVSSSVESSVVGGKVLYDSVKRAAITTVKDWKGCLAVGLGHRLMMYQWDGIAGRLRGVGMIDLGLQISSIAFFKSFIVASDILRGVFLLRYKEDPVMDLQGRIVSMAASIQQIAKSAPLQSLSVALVETIRLEGSVGIVSIDVMGNIDLETFSPVHFGQFLRQSLPFQLPAKSVAVAQVGTSRKSLVIGTASGSLCQLIPVSESEHHMAQTLNGLMIALLPQLGGVNPRLFHIGVGRESPPNVPQTVESVDLLLSFLYLSTPLQAEIASRMKQPIDVLMRAVAKWVRPVLY